jgi:hypothetical protein
MDRFTMKRTSVLELNEELWALTIAQSPLADLSVQVDPDPRKPF